MPFKRQFAFRRLAALLIGWRGLSATLLAGSAQAEVRLRAPAARPPASGTVAFALTVPPNHTRASP